MVEDFWGLKHQCLECGALFYDMGKDPITCPACEKIHSLENAIKLKPVSMDEESSDQDDLDTSLDPDLEADLDVGDDAASVLENTDDLASDDDDVAVVVSDEEESDN